MATKRRTCGELQAWCRNIWAGWMDLYVDVRTWRWWCTGSRARLATKLAGDGCGWMRSEKEMRTPRSSVASAERKELYSADSCDCDARARQHGRNIIHGGGGSVEFPVPCWRRHSDSSLSPFHSPARSFFLIFSFSRAAARSELGRGVVVAVPVAAAVRAFLGKGTKTLRQRHRAVRLLRFSGDLRGYLPAPKHRDVDSVVAPWRNKTQS
jgi:hypothetical protein